MCTEIPIVLPRDADIAFVERLLIERKRRWSSRGTCATAEWRWTTLHVRLVSDDDSAHGWLAFIRAVVASGATERIGVAVTPGGPGELERGEAMRAATPTARELHAMQSGVVYSFTA